MRSPGTGRLSQIPMNCGMAILNDCRGALGHQRSKVSVLSHMIPSDTSWIFGGHAKSNPLAREFWPLPEDNFLFSCLLTLLLHLDTVPPSTPPSRSFSILYYRHLRLHSLFPENSGI